MNKQFGRFLLAGVCGLVIASASHGADNSSHRLLDTDYGNLSQAQDLLDRRLHHTEDLQKFQDLIKDKTFQEMVKKFKPEEVEAIKESVKNNPGLVDDLRFGELLKEAEKLKQGEGFGLSDDDKNQFAQKAKDLFGQTKSSNHSSDKPVTAGSPDATNTNPSSPPAPEPAPPATLTESLSHQMAQDMADIFKEVNRSPEGESLRKTILNALDNPNAGPSGSSDTTNFLEHLITPQQARWLTYNLKPPSWPKFGGWSSSNASPFGGSAIGGGAFGGLETAVWVMALALFGVAAALAIRAASQQAARGRTSTWSAGPWPVHPSRVSTREDLIRAFEHLAFLCLGPTARHLNHLDVAGRLGETAGDRVGPATRLAYLYEQARYAPPEELLASDELAAARGDLSTLAGAAA